MTLADMHPELFRELKSLAERAAACGDSPGDVRACVEALVCDAIMEVTHERNNAGVCNCTPGCEDCASSTKHTHATA